MALSRSHPHLWSEPKLQVGPVAITGVCPQDSVSEKAEPVAPLQKDPPSTGEPSGSLSRVRLVCFQPPLLLPYQGFGGHVVLPASSAKGVWRAAS